MGPGLRRDDHREQPLTLKHSEPALFVVLEAEIARHHALVAADLFCRAAHDELAKLHHIGAVGDFEGGAGILLEGGARPRIAAPGKAMGRSGTEVTSNRCLNSTSLRCKGGTK